MPSRKYLPLTPNEVERVLKALGFEHKRTRGDHAQWEGTVKGVRRVSTVQLIRGEYSEDRMKRIIENLGLTVEEFYGADAKIAKRYFGR
jgi:predicted RNA binding protein YcfA (HicA-like mRNA interferase family)